MSQKAKEILEIIEKVADQTNYRNNVIKEKETYILNENYERKEVSQEKLKLLSNAMSMRCN